MRWERQMWGRRGRWGCEIIKGTCLGRGFWMEACSLVGVGISVWCWRDLEIRCVCRRRMSALDECLSMKVK